MAKKKRTKPKTQASMVKKYKSKDEQIRGYIVAKKLLRHFDLESLEGCINPKSVTCYKYLYSIGERTYT